jgi:hypothetical protein
VFLKPEVCTLINIIGASGIPEALRDWLYEKDSEGYAVRELKGLRIVFGPNNDSWFATDGLQYRWINLPPGLDAALENRRSPGGGWTDRPRLIALGAMKNFIMITEGNGGSWLLSQYRQLDAVLDILKAKDDGFALIHVS